MPISEAFIEHTQQLWGRRLGRPVPEDEARQMIRNVAAFFDLLIRWDRESRARQEEAPADDTKTSSATTEEGSDPL